MAVRVSAVPPGAETVDTVAAEGAEKAIGGFKVPSGHTVELFAAEPLLGNPVAICVDEQGRVFVAETYRFGKGVSDNRQSGYWLDDDLAAMTIDDRLAYYRKWAEQGKRPMNWFTDHSDQVRMIVDEDGDGRADHSTVFAGGFNDPLAGLGSGVIARDGNIYYTNIPDLWLLRDNDGDGKADVRKSLHRGFGVRTAFLGHDLHGLAWGPDGKLYFSVGDRGYHLTTPEGRTLSDPGRGAVFRCDPDGSNLEVVYRGLRNPQELAFDKFGNLFTGDNNSDAGDAARLVYIVEGGDSGWHMSYQYLGGDYSRGPWHMEKVWHNQNDDQPAWTLPPIRNIGGGPSGFVYYPGVGLDKRYDNHFFLCDFHGSSKSSRIESFAVEPKGAGFELIDDHTFLDNILATDVTFGYDGRMYISDWINGWGGTGKGRIYTLKHDQHVTHPAVTQTRKLFGEGFNDRDAAELIELLYHADMRVRLRAQYALASRGAASIDALLNVAKNDSNQVARLHAMWGLGQIAASGDAGNPLSKVRDLLSDGDAEVRSHAARLMGDHGVAAAAPQLVTLLGDDNRRVRFFAAMSLGKLKHKPAIEPIVRVLRENADADRFLRHACVMGLQRMDDTDAVLAYANDASRAVRMGVLLVLRRNADPRIARFLTDADEGIVTEAARAIHDLPIKDAMPALADIIEKHAKVEVSASTAAAGGGLKVEFRREYFHGLGNRGIDQVLGEKRFSGKPSKAESSAIAMTKPKHGNDYASRLSGVIEAPADGAYTFFLSADDRARLWVSTDADPANKRQVLDVPDWKPPTEWVASKPITLTKGQRYYIEAVHVEGGGQDHVAIGWKLPDGTIERPIGSGGEHDAYGRSVSKSGGDGLASNHPLIRRVLNANLRLGDEAYAAKVVRFAATASADEAMRLEALGVLGAWAKPNPRDRVMGDWRPQPKRDKAIARRAIERSLGSLLGSASGTVEAKVTQLMSQYDVQSDPGAFVAWVGEANRPAASRVEALRLLASRNHEKLDSAIDTALSSDVAPLRAEAVRVLAARGPQRAVGEAKRILAGDSVEARQRVLAILGTMNHAASDALLAEWVSRLTSGQVAAPIRLDVREAAKARQDKSATVSAALKAYALTFPAGDMVAPHRDAMHGGDASNGEKLFESHVAAQCMRCHMVNNRGGHAGPDLSKIGERAKRDYLLESLVNPSAKIAEGYEMVILTTKDGGSYAGTLVSDKGGKLTIAPPAGDPVTIDADNVASRTSQKISAMPPMGAILKPMELRDVIEYLASLK